MAACDMIPVVVIPNCSPTLFLGIVPDASIGEACHQPRKRMAASDSGREAVAHSIRYETPGWRSGLRPSNFPSWPLPTIAERGGIEQKPLSLTGHAALYWMTCCHVSKMERETGVIHLLVIPRRSEREIDGTPLRLRANFACLTPAKDRWTAPGRTRWPGARMRRPVS